MYFIVVLLLALSLSAKALNPVIGTAGNVMNLLKPIFTLEAKLQAGVLGTLGKVDKDEVKEELSALADEGCVVYTYGLSPFSTEAIAALDASGCKYEKRELGLEWFLLGPRASVLRGELLEQTGQSSLPHIFIGGESIGGLSTGSPGLAKLIKSGELEEKIKATKKKKTKSEPKKFAFKFFGK